MSIGDVNKGYHCAWQIHYHLVFPVKYRKALLEPAVVEIIKETTQGIQERYEIEMEAMGMDDDHIHLLCGAHPKTPPGEIVRIFKSITAREMYTTFPELKKMMWGTKLWEQGYFVRSVGDETTTAAIMRYVEKQGKQRGVKTEQLKFFN